ncbi:MAG: DUF1810 domain-containing protein [Butyrivibrio sp.]|nr:DUF1810 domain-containing protein [Butyrivibrio sp.]
MYDLSRFIKAQENEYKIAVSEIKAGGKSSCWMWYIFPQVKGLGNSAISKYYALDGLGEAKAYLKNKVLKDRLEAICLELLKLKSNDAAEIFGYPDNFKLHSSMTVFLLAEPGNEVFRAVLDKFFDGKMDLKTQNIIEKEMDTK